MSKSTDLDILSLAFSRIGLNDNASIRVVFCKIGFTVVFFVRNAKSCTAQVTSSISGITFPKKNRLGGDINTLSNEEPGNETSSSSCAKDCQSVFSSVTKLAWL